WLSHLTAPRAIAHFPRTLCWPESDPAGGLWQRVFKQNKRRTGRAHARSDGLSVQTARESRPTRRIGLVVPVALDDLRCGVPGHQFRQIGRLEGGLVEGEAIMEGIGVARRGLFDAGENVF